jgi:hypothetical protein
MNKKERIYNDYIFIDDNKTKLTKEKFIRDNFITTDDKNDRLHTETICDILNKKGFKFNTIYVGRLLNQMEVGKYTNKCSIDKVRKGGFEYIKYTM